LEEGKNTCKQNVYIEAKHIFIARHSQLVQARQNSASHLQLTSDTKKIQVSEKSKHVAEMSQG